MSGTVLQNQRDLRIFATEMQLTARYLRERFRVLNVQYFGSELPEPQLMVSDAKTQLGQFSCRRMRKGFFGGYQNTGFKIKVSEYYEQTADEVDDTLLHEMIHYLIAYRQLRDASAHGPLFRREMARLNRMGRHITISSRTARMEVAEQHKRQQHLVLALQDRDGRCFLSVVNPSYRKYVEAQLTLVPKITHHQWVVSRDDYFNGFSQVRSLRARRVTREKYDEVVNMMMRS